MKSNSKREVKKLVLLDAHAIIHRAYHALPEFATSKGEPTGALYGLSTMLIKLITDLKPDYIAACFDLPGPTYRHQALESYKAGRSKLDEALAVQLERAKDVFRAWGIPVYSCPGFEADDILGTIVKDLKKEKDLEIVIASGDMDTLQLVDKKKVQVYTLKKGLSDTVLYDEKKVVARFGFEPLLLPDYKGLRGDPSDNIIGVKGIGEKTATSLITTFGTIEKIYKALKKDDEAYKKAGITKRIADLLIENEEEALFSKTLATIRDDAPINFTMPGHWLKCLNIDTLINHFQELEFRTLGERAKKLVEVSSAGSGEKAIAESLENGSGETNSAVLTLSTGAPTTDGIAPALAQELGLMLWVVDSNITNPDLEDVFRFTKAKDTETAKKVLEKELDARGVRSVYEDIETPLIPGVARMRDVGIKVDRTELERLSKTYHAELTRLEQSIWKHAGEEFNVNSPKVLSEILFTKLDLAEKRQKKTPTGALSTKESELVKLKDKHPIIGEILEYRELQKLLSTYIDTIPTLLGEDSRLHSTFILAGSTTGRMASANPNMQNIPTKTPLGRAIRNAFIAEDGYKLVAIDYSQIELRIAAILSQDEKLVDIFKKGIDVHAGVASRVFGVPPEEVTKEMRIKAKTINFGILFGMGVSALKVNLGTDRKEAQEFYNNYFVTFTGLAEYLERTKRETEEKGYTETMFGRRRYFSGFRSPLPYVRAQAERMAINAPIQGTEADILKIAMKQVDEYIKEKGREEDVRMLLQVHDELVFEVKEELVDEVTRDLKKIMESPFEGKETLGVPIVVEAHTGDNWGEME